MVYAGINKPDFHGTWRYGSQPIALLRSLWTERTAGKACAGDLGSCRAL